MYSEKSPVSSSFPFSPRYHRIIVSPLHQSILADPSDLITILHPEVRMVITCLLSKDIFDWCDSRLYVQSISVPVRTFLPMQMT